MVRVARTVQRGTGMTAVFKIRRYTEREVDSLISLMTANGYKVSFEKGDRVTTKVIISKDGQEYIGEDE